MKLYIKAMALSRAELIKIMESYSHEISQHVAKCSMYCDSLGNGKYDHWISEIAGWISYINNIVCKFNKGKLKPQQYADTLFGGLSDDLNDAEAILHALQIHNGKSVNPYPFREVDYNMSKRMVDCGKIIIETFVPILAVKNNLTSSSIKAILHDILDPICNLE